MANTNYIFSVRNSTISSGDNRGSGLTPTWVFLKTLVTSSGITGGNLPSISGIGFGQYQFTYNPDITGFGEAAGQIDAGSGLTNGSDRYIDVLLGVSPASLTNQGLVNVSMVAATGQATNYQTALLALWRRFFKKVSLDSSNNLICYADDNSTTTTSQTVSDNGVIRISSSAG